MNWKLWLKGLASAIIGAFFSAVSLCIVDPLDYNITDWVAAKKLLIVCTVSAIIALAAYLKQSPLPNGSTQKHL